MGEWLGFPREGVIGVTSLAVLVSAGGFLAINTHTEPKPCSEIKPTNLGGLACAKMSIQLGNALGLNLVATPTPEGSPERFVIGPASER